MANYLNRKNITAFRRQKKLQSLLKIVLAANITWIKNFGEMGIIGLFQQLHYAQEKNLPKMSHTCILIFQNLLNAKYAFNIVINTEYYLKQIYQSMESQNSELLGSASLTLAAFCIYSHVKIISAITQYHVITDTPRFKLVVDALTVTKEGDQGSVLKFINTILSSTIISYRIHLRSELEQCKLSDIIKKFLNGTESIYQWEIYLKNQKNDYKIFFSKIQKSETVMDDPIECFSYIIMTVQDFQAHIYLKNLANFFLMILITGKKINIYFKVIEQIVGQIVLGSSNIFEDSKYGLLVQGISEIINNLDYRNRYKMYKEINEALGKKLNQANQTIKKLRLQLKSKVESKNPITSAKLDQQKSFNEKSQKANTENSSISSNKKSSLQPMLDESISSLAPPPPPPLHPPLPLGLPPQVPGLGPLPPPPPPGLGPPPSPPMSGGLPAPPSLQGILGPLASEPKKILPIPKKDYHLSKPVKKIPWSKIPNRRIGKDSFWVKANSKYKLFEEKLLEEIVLEFSLKQISTFDI